MITEYLVFHSIKNEASAEVWNLKYLFRRFY
jgi:hypothetical protein